MKALGKLFAGLAMACLATALQAQTYPAKPIRLIVPFAPGGGTDILGRTAARIMGAGMGQTMIVENRPGASGTVGLDGLVASAPDGYTIMLLATSTAVAHHFLGREFNFSKLMVPIGNIITTQMMLAVGPKKIDVKSFAELVAYLKANPGTDYSTSGPGSPGELGMAGWARQMKISVTHVPYKGINPAMTDVIAGRVGMIIIDATSAKSHVDSNAIRPLAILGAKKLSYTPGTPTTVELGYPDFAIEIYAGLVAPAGTPSVAVERLRKASQELVVNEEYLGAFRQTGLPEYIDGPAWATAIQRQYDQWGIVIKEAGIKPN